MLRQQSLTVGHARKLYLCKIRRMEQLKTGLNVSHPEKNAAKVVREILRDTFSGPVRGQESPNCGNFLRFSR